ncbi:MAG: hypothetical protein JJU00_10050 [Opitutales bacterium]|nr:hypothetical protein [Opitutales bacterium]
MAHSFAQLNHKTLCCSWMHHNPFCESYFPFREPQSALSLTGEPQADRSEDAESSSRKPEVYRLEQENNAASANAIHRRRHSRGTKTDPFLSQEAESKTMQEFGKWSLWQP